MDGKQLKNSILQWAIQGKLVPQNPKDEPASKLLERIAESRNESSLSLPKGTAKGTKSKDLKKKTSKNPPSRIYRENGVWYEQIGTATPKDISDEIPFEIPENWAWCRLGEMGNTITGSTPSKLNPEYIGSDIPFLSPGDISLLNKIISYDSQGLSLLGKSVARPVPPQTILQVCIGGSIGKCAVVDREVCFNQQINAITLEEIDYKYVYEVLQSKIFQDLMKSKSTGTATPIINKGAWDLLMFPLPPLAEQKRIVAKLEQVLPLAEEYGAAQEQLDKLNKELPEALKKSILQEAIQGKLVPQNPKDEPASVLLAKIRKEKESLVKQGKLKKKDLEITPIDDDEIPFELPTGWIWARFEDLSLDSADGPFGSNLKKEHYTDKKEVRIIQLSNISENGWRDLNTKYTSFEHLKNISRSEAFPGDIIIAKMMPAGRAIICPDMDKKYVLSSDAVRFDFSNLLYKKYLYWAINSTVVKDQVYSEVQGITRVRTSLSKLRTYLIPVPPLAEQKRIVAKLEQLFKVL